MLFDRADEVDAGVVDEDVDRPEPRLGLTDGIGTLVRVGDIQLDRETRVAGSAPLRAAIGVKRSVLRATT